LQSEIISGFIQKLMILLLNDIIKAFEQEIPLSLQEPWDKSGLQIGSKRQKIRNVLFAYDACHEVLRYAAKNKIDLIVTHHPLSLSDIKNLSLDSYEGEIFRLAIKNNIAIYTAHTSHDSSPHSLNRHYAKKLGLQNISPLRPIKDKPFVKLVVYVPVNHTEKVMEAVFTAGGGTVGHYSCCSFRTNGTGTFKGDNTTTPFLGTQGKLEEADENRVEFLIVRNRLQPVIQAMLAAHPYEEVAYDLFALENSPSQTGLGIYGKLSTPKKLSALVPTIKKLFNTSKVRLTGKSSKIIRSIGLCTGSGTSLLESAVANGVDLFITGDVKYHNAISALRENIALLDVGHFHSEIRSVTLLKDLFKKIFGNQLTLSEYTRLKDPFFLL